MPFFGYYRARIVTSLLGHPCAGIDEDYGAEERHESGALALLMNGLRGVRNKSRDVEVLTAQHSHAIGGYLSTTRPRHQLQRPHRIALASLCKNRARGQLMVFVHNVAELVPDNEK